MTTRLARFSQTALLLTSLVPGVAYAQTQSAPKLDESLRETVANGCVGTRSVIIRLQPGYREGLRASLTAHGDRVTGEFPGLDAVGAQVHCEDLTTLAGFTSTKSVSVNAPVGVQSLLTSLVSTTLSTAQAAVTTARANVARARETVTTAQQAARVAETAASNAQAQVGAAQKAVTAANKLSGLAKTTALVAANAKLVAAQAALTAAQTVLDNARAAVISANAALLAAQDKLVDAQGDLANAKELANREREGQAALRLKKKFFATMAARGESEVETDEIIDTDTDDSATNLAASTDTVPTDGAIGLAIVDSGIQPGIDFGNRITAFYDFTQGDIRAVAANDGYGHGTHVAGLAASQFVGVAPNARLIGLKVLDDKGRGTTDNVVRAIEFAITNKAALGINILNLSLGHPIFEPAATDPLVQAVEHATRAGIAVVLSAGNFGMNPKTGQPGYAGIASPGNAPSGLTVGAVRTFNTVSRLDDRVAPYSSRGPTWYDGFAKPDFVAPGDNLLSVAALNSTLRIAQELRGNTGNYMRLSGTSMAAGVASGVVALVLQANHGLTPNAVKAVLEYSSIQVNDDLGKPFDPLAQGAGQIEVGGAVAFARTINSGAGVGSSWLSTSTKTSTTIGARPYKWSQSIIWGARRVAGAKLLEEQRPAWALNVVWGQGLGDEDDNIVWGNNFGDDDNIVWGNSFDFGDNIVWGNNIVFGDDDNIVWGNLFDDGDNIVWGNLFDADDNIVWGNNVVWGNALVGMSLDDDDNIVWGNDLGDGDNIVWGNLFDDNIVWGNLFDDDNIVWGNSFGEDDDNIVWGNAAQLGNVIQWSGGLVKSGNSRGRRSVKKEGVN